MMEKMKILPRACNRVAVKEKEKVKTGRGRRSNWDGQCSACIYRSVGKPGGPKRDIARCKDTKVFVLGIKRSSRSFIAPDVM